MYYYIDSDHKYTHFINKKTQNIKIHFYILRPNYLIG